MAGSSAYPGGLDDFAEESPANLGDEDTSGRTHSERHDDIEAAIENLQAELGTDPAGSYATVRERIAGVETTVGVVARDTEVYTTASLADDAEETGTVTLAKGYRLLRIATDVAARVRVYTTAAKRTADAARAVGVDPTGDHGVVLDAVTTGALLAFDLSPTVDGWNNESTPSASIPIAVQNLSGTTDTVAVTFTFIQTEA